MFRVGTTVIVADIGVVPVFVAVNDAIFPEPPAANPIAVLEFVHAKVAPAGVLIKFVPAIISLLQTVVLAGTVTFGTGLMIIFAVALVATHPFAAAMLFVTV